METKQPKVNLASLNDYLTNSTHPDTLAVHIDTLLYEHMRLILLLFEKGIGLRTMDIHSDTAHIYNEMRILRDLLRSSIVEMQE